MNLGHTHRTRARGLLSRRKELRRQAARRHNVSVNDLAWRDGRLVFTASGHLIPDVPTVEKPGAAAARARLAEELKRVEADRAYREGQRRERTAQTAREPARLDRQDELPYLHRLFSGR